MNCDKLFCHAKNIWSGMIYPDPKIKQWLLCGSNHELETKPSKKITNSNLYKTGKICHDTGVRPAQKILNPTGIRIHKTLVSSSDADPGCLSRIRIFSIPDPGSASKNVSILTQKIVTVLSEIWSWLFIPDPDPDFLSIPDPVSRGQKGTGSRIRIRNTGFFPPPFLLHTSVGVFVWPLEWHPTAGWYSAQPSQSPYM